MALSEDDLEVRVWPRQGFGGQHVGTSGGAILIVHKPTGTAFLSQTERSQLRNRENAMEQLRVLLKLKGIE